MSPTVECPYCEEDNDMSDGLIDLPSSNEFEHCCEHCEKEFNVHVEFEPSYSSSKIVYEKCDSCGRVGPDFKKRGSVYPFPTLNAMTLCNPCFFNETHLQHKKRTSKETI